MIKNNILIKHRDAESRADNGRNTAAKRVTSDWHGPDITIPRLGRSSFVSAAVFAVVEDRVYVLHNGFMGIQLQL